MPYDERDGSPDPGEAAVRATRDRDELGRARNARPRDEWGRPLPRGAIGTPRLAEGQVRTPDETIELAQRLLGERRPFHAHEVFEDAWKSATSDSADAGSRDLWKGYAQLAVGLTHCGRGNPHGAVSLLRRGVENLARFSGTAPYRLRVDATVAWATDLADRIERDGLPDEPPALPTLR